MIKSSFGFILEAQNGQTQIYQVKCKINLILIGLFFFSIRFLLVIKVSDLKGNMFSIF